MTIFQAVVLGVIQGLTEPLPVSSSAHLALTPYFLGWQDPGLAFDVALHLGTLLALIWYFRNDWASLLGGAWRIATSGKVRDENDRAVVYLTVATIPGGIAGLLLQDLAESSFRAPIIIAVSLMLLGILLWLIDHRASSSRTMRDITLRDAVIVGCTQAMALVPGVSRSGSTMTAGRFLGLSRPAAARFSFLMSMPIIAAAVVLKVPEALREHGGMSAPMIAGVLSAALSSWLAIAVLLRYVSRHSFGVFAVYRVLLALVVFGTLVLRP